MEDMGSYVSIDKICLEMGEDIIEMLPAVHALTGCDTTRKIETKRKALQVVKSLQYLTLNHLVLVN